MNTAQWKFHPEKRSVCQHCEDSGYRRVVHRQTVQDWLNGTPGYFYTCAVACDCRAGDEKFPDATDKEGHVRVYPRYDAVLHCLAEEVKHADNLAALKIWIEGYKQHEVERQYADQWQPANGATYAGRSRQKQVDYEEGREAVEAFE